MVCLCFFFFFLLFPNKRLSQGGKFRGPGEPGSVHEVGILGRDYVGEAEEGRLRGGGIGRGQWREKDFPKVEQGHRSMGAGGSVEQRRDLEGQCGSQPSLESRVQVLGDENGRKTREACAALILSACANFWVLHDISWGGFCNDLDDTI